jgi:hypothetical protein
LLGEETKEEHEKLEEAVDSMMEPVLGTCATSHSTPTLDNSLVPFCRNITKPHNTVTDSVSRDHPLPSQPVLAICVHMLMQGR